MKKLAIKGGEPARKKSFPKWPIITEEEITSVEEVLKSGKWWYGEKVKEFEKRYAAFQDTKYGVSCVNGTAALEVALLAMGIGAGDEVIVPPYTFVATAYAVLKANAIPIFADVKIEDANIDPEDIVKKMTDKTKAIIPVHIAGNPCDMERILKIAKEHKLKVLEDACHSWGTKWQGKGAGSLGDAGVFSFQMSKNITSGEGGIITTSDEEIADTARSYINVGRGKKGGWYEHVRLGVNLRLTEIQAAILLVQLKRLQGQTLKRQENALYLDSKLKEIPGLIPTTTQEGTTIRSYHLYMFRFIEDEWGITREKFIKALQSEGIPCSPGYTPLYKNKIFLEKRVGSRGCPLSCPYYGKDIDYSQVCCPNAEKLSQEMVWFPQSLLLADKEDMRDIVRAIEKIWVNRDELKEGK